MKIAIFGLRGYPYVYSGYETFVAELAPRLAAAGYHVCVYCHASLFVDRPKSVNGVHLVYLPAIERKILSQWTHSLLATLHASFSDADIVFAVNAANGPFGFILRLFGKLTVINVDGLEWLRPKWKGLGARYFKWAARCATRRFDMVVTDAVAMAKVYEIEFGATSTVIAYGAHIEQCEAESELNALNLVPRSYYLIVGRLIPDNNADVIIQGFLRSKTSKRLIIVGDVPYRDAYATRVRSVADPRIMFLGYVRGKALLDQLYWHAYAYFHGHEFGGTNPALLNALGLSCCVLALDTVFSREVLMGEEFGILFDKNPDHIASRMDMLEQHPEIAERYRGKAADRIRANYRWEKIARQYGELFEMMVSTKQNRPMRS